MADPAACTSTALGEKKKVIKLNDGGGGRFRPAARTAPAERLVQKFNTEDEKGGINRICRRSGTGY